MQAAFMLCAMLLAGGDARADPPPPGKTPEPSRPSRRSPESIQQQLAEFHQRFPTLTRLVTLGYSHEGRPVRALVIGRDVQAADSRPSVLLNGAHHGGEVISIDVVLDAIEVLLERSTPGRRDLGAGVDLELDRRVARWLDRLVVWCVPQVNPDGTWAVLNGAKRSDRKNGRDNNGNGRIDKSDGVDLNRNYPYRWGTLGEKGSSSKTDSEYFRGRAAASEPEVQAMIALAEREHFAASVSYHTGTVALLAPYTIDGAPSPSPNEAWSVAEHVASRMPRHPQKGTVQVRRNLYPVDGTDQDFLRHQFGTLAILVESASHSPSSTADRLALVKAVRPSWMLLLDRLLDGPAVHGQVRDASGRPVVAEVSLAEQSVADGETWSTRCRDGLYARFLPQAGRYRLRVRLPGSTQPPIEQTFDATAGLVRLDVTVPAGSATPCPSEP